MRKAQEEADAAALLVIVEAEQKVADAEARAAAAEAKAADAEAVADLLQSEALLAIKPAEEPAVVSDEEYEDCTWCITEKGKANLARARAEDRLRLELREALAGKNRLQVADALVAGTLHPAVKIDWSLV